MIGLEELFCGYVVGCDVEDVGSFGSGGVGYGGCFLVCL